MAVKILKVPSERNCNIYYDHCARNITQKALATQNKISQPRISQIIKSVGDFIRRQAPYIGGSTSQNMYAAFDVFRQTLHDMEWLARDAFVAQAKFYEERVKAWKPGDKDPPRPDVRLYTGCLAAMKEQMANAQVLYDFGAKIIQENERLAAQALYTQTAHQEKYVSNNDFSSYENESRAGCAGQSPLEAAPATTIDEPPVTAAAEPIAAAPAPAPTPSAAPLISPAPAKTPSPAKRPENHCGHRFGPTADPSYIPTPPRPRPPRDPRAIVWYSMREVYSP